MKKIKILSLSYLDNHLLAALVQANEIIKGTHPDPEMGKRSVQRALDLFDIDEGAVTFYCLPTTAELPSTDWD